MKILLAWLPLLGLLAIWISGGLIVRTRVRSISPLAPSDDASPMDVITIYRKPESANHLRRYQIEIDDSLVGSLKPGELKHFPVAAGQHTLAVRIDWCRSYPLTVTKAVNSNLRLECGASVQNWRRVIQTFFRPREYLYIALTDQVDKRSAEKGGRRNYMLE